MDSSQLSIGLAFLAGLVSFLSPCMLPLVPIYLTQLVGQSVSQAEKGSAGWLVRLHTFVHATLFVLGFTLAFVALGATASELGRLMRPYQFQLRQIGGIVLVVIGLHLTGILTIPLFYRQKRLTLQPTRSSYPLSLLIGIIFAIGWTTLYQSGAWFGPWPGSIRRNTPTRGLLPAGVLVWDGVAVSAAGSRRQPGQSLFETAFPASREDSNCDRRRDDPGRNHDFFQLARLF